MANTSAQLAAEKWIASHELPARFDGLAFEAKKLKLKWGGDFAFDAVSSDGEIVALISTSSARTASGKSATAKFQKLKADALYLLNAVGATQLLMIFTEETMQVHFEKERKAGRFPPEIEFLHVNLPDEIRTRVLEARRIASAETTPINKGK